MPKGSQITVRVEDAIVERIDAIVARMRGPMIEPRRSDIVRECLIRALPLIEAEVLGRELPRKTRRSRQ